MRIDLNVVPEGEGEEPRMALPQSVIDWMKNRPAPPLYNGYQCKRRPDHVIITIDIHSGVTPMFLGCRFNEHCKSQSVSMGYPNNGAGPVPHGLRKSPLWLWYRPSLGEFLNLNPESSDHIMQGGLLIKPAGVSLDEWELKAT